MRPHEGKEPAHPGNRRTLLAVRYPKSKSTAPHYVDIDTGEVVGTHVGSNDRLTLGRWCIESRRDHDWVREFSYPNIPIPFSGAQLLPEHI